MATRHVDTDHPSHFDPASYPFRTFEFTLNVPGRYTLIDHALPRALNKGAAGYLEIEGAPHPSIVDGAPSGRGSSPRPEGRRAPRPRHHREAKT